MDLKSKARLLSAAGPRGETHGTPGQAPAVRRAAPVHCLWVPGSGRADGFVLA
jgi:hypothetical protein